MVGGAIEQTNLGELVPQIISHGSGTSNGIGVLKFFQAQMELSPNSSRDSPGNHVTSRGAGSRFRDSRSVK
jgi:hypothetical protein